MAVNNRRSLLLVVCFVLTSSSLLGPIMAQTSDPRLIDSDGDSLSDWDEVNRYWSDPNNYDTDGDTIDDGREVRTGTSPIDTDSDGDHYSDTLEYSIWNPQAVNREDRYYRCPYIADIPSFSIDLPVNQTVIKHYYFSAGTEKTESTLVSSIEGIELEQSFTVGLRNSYRSWENSFTRTGERLENTRSASVSGSVEVGYSQSFGVDVAGIGQTTTEWSLGFSVGGEHTWNYFEMKPYTETETESATSTERERSNYYEKSGTTMNLLSKEDQDTINQYSDRGWNFDKLTITADIPFGNDGDRTVLLENIVFEISVGGIRLRSLDWGFSPVTLAPGESHTFTVSFEFEGEEWIYRLLMTPTLLSVSPESFEVSIYSDDDGWLSQDVMQEEVTSKCTLVEIWDGVSVAAKKWITATVDKIDGLNAIRALDLLFIPYVYKYNRMIELFGKQSKPGQVWAFLYSHRWDDVVNTIDTEVSFSRVRMWGRGFLQIDLALDSDGDWLPDDSEIFATGTDPYLPDTDGDSADDYVECVIMRSDPNDVDTDDGGTYDGIEYFEGLNASDPTDDLLDMPDWYTNHPTMQYMSQAYDWLLSYAEMPSPDTMTWVAPESPGEIAVIDTLGYVPYATNETIDLTVDDVVLSSDIGDIDRDGVNEIVVGTYPAGKVVLFDYDINTGSWSEEVLIDMSSKYAHSPVKIWDISIGDADNSADGVMEIVIGTWYFQGTDKGDVIMLYEYDNVWYDELINSATIQGGVYSVEVGDAGLSTGNEVVVGTGGSSSVTKANITVFAWSGSAWQKTDLLRLNSSKLNVVVGDYHSDGVRDVVYCSYGTNSSLGFIKMDTLTDYRIEQYGQSDPLPESFMYVGLADVNNDARDDLVVAIDNVTVGADRIVTYQYPSLGPYDVVDQIEFAGRQLVAEDIDNDGLDEIVYHVVNQTDPDTVEIRVAEKPESVWIHTTIEVAAESDLRTMAAGDILGDGDIDFLYGTGTTGLIRTWNHPTSWLWPAQETSWNFDISYPSNWIYEDEMWGLGINIENVGPIPLDNFSISVDSPLLLRNMTPTFEEFDSVAEGVSEFLGIDYMPDTSGEYNITILFKADYPAIEQSVTLTCLVRPMPAFHAELGKALLDMAGHTNNESILETASKFGDWLHGQAIRVGSAAAWNLNANMTTEPLTGHIMATIKTGRFFLRLFSMTKDTNFLSDALLAARYLQENAVSQSAGGLAWSSHANGFVDACEAAQFLLEISQILQTNYFDNTITGVLDYLEATATNDESGTYWKASYGATVAAAKLFTLVGAYGTIDPEDIALWFRNQIIDDQTWYDSLTPSYRHYSPYSYYTGTAIGMVLDVVSGFGIETMQIVVDKLVTTLETSALTTASGLNWQESTWTTNESKLLDSIGFDRGTSGLMIALSEAYKATADDMYLELAMQASNWTGASVNEIASRGIYYPGAVSVFGEVITALVHIRQTMPVVVAGYFVDPITSLSEGPFVLIGYVYTSGWHAKGVNITAHIPGTMIFANGDTPTHVIGEPDEMVELTSWSITMLPTGDPSILYGSYDLTAEVTSENAGTDSTLGRVVVTDLGVSKIQTTESEPSLFSLKILAQGTGEQVYSVAYPVLVPVQVEYANGDIAYNASVTVGNHGTVSVNESGYAYIQVTEYEPGTYDIPVYVEYDKNSGITTSSQNMTLSLTFSGVEVYDLSPTKGFATAGEQITISGKLRYAHDGSPVQNGIAAIAGVFNGILEIKTTVADENGEFILTISEGAFGVSNYTVFGYLEGQQIFLPVNLETISVEWSGFWNVQTIAVTVGLLGASVVLLLIFMRRRLGKTTGVE